MAEQRKRARPRTTIVLTAAVAVSLLVAPLLAAPGLARAAEDSGNTSNSPPCPCDLFGSRVGTVDTDTGARLTALFAELGFLDLDDDGAISTVNETVYIDADQDHETSEGDVRLTSAPGSRVRFDDVDVAESLEELFADFMVLDPVASGDASPLPVYLDVDGDAAVSPFDVRVTASDGGPAGTFVQAGDADVGDPLDFPGFEIGFHDAGNDGLLGLEDPLYLAQQGGEAVPGDVRLAAIQTEIDVRPVFTTDGDGARTTAPHVEATVRTAVSGTPVQGQLVQFSSDDRFLCSAVTNASGVARCGGVAATGLALVGGEVTAVLEGTAPFCGSQGSAPLGLVDVGDVHP